MLPLKALGEGLSCLSAPAGAHHCWHSSLVDALLQSLPRGYKASYLNVCLSLCV